MSYRRRRSWRDARYPPPWWPQNEDWPPDNSPALRDQVRRRLARRTGWYAFFPLWILIWSVVRLLNTPGSIGGMPVSGGATLLLICAAAAAGVAVVVRFIAEPIAEIVSASARVAKRDYRVRVNVPRFGPAWLGDTARAFNAMAKQLEVQDQARRHLMADIAHELRTPLAVLQGKIEGIIDGVYPRDNKVLEELLDEARVLTRLVEDLRTLSTAESGSLALTKEPTDIAALVNDAAASMVTRATEAGVTLRVETDAAGDIDPIAVDPLRIREVLTNLIANALRHTPRDGRVLVTLAPHDAGVAIKVIDTGEGIGEEDLPRIFDRFYKSGASSGTGLGLTIARSLVEAHGGTIRAESRRGTGTTMTVGLPR